MQNKIPFGIINHGCFVNSFQYIHIIMHHDWEQSEIQQQQQKIWSIVRWWSIFSNNFSHNSSLFVALVSVSSLPVLVLLFIFILIDNIYYTMPWPVRTQNQFFVEDQKPKKQQYMQFVWNVIFSSFGTITGVLFLVLNARIKQHRSVTIYLLFIAKYN